ncbi:LacI family DNA-binding transcriptional regulator [Lachnoclostridium sp. Marseille-P6806]|uniref:LacI family DNA-binding transcriptional regulator n=1 Tax=Lachnoclostridium sp. Marseille-P6806 TaxID=2364793 RepID=UPI0013EF25CF|nr:LacI family DNA-binding transcriptional regulator [Lachnoclostridium sp. Marseille-P6806]
MSITLADVAADAGVTVTTVSRVLNNRGAISESTRSKVRESIQKLGYIPNEAARSLGNKRTNVIGVIVPSIANPFFSELVDKMEIYAFRKGYRIQLCNSYRQPDKEKEYISLLKANKVAGIVISSRTPGIENDLNGNFPVVSLERVINENTSAVVCDNYEGARIATQHLIDCGCRRLGSFLVRSDVAMAADKRIDAFQDVCRTNRIPCHVFEAKEEQFQFMCFEEFCSSVLEQRPDIDGYFACGDITAIQLLAACQKKGLRVPEEIRIVGFDDLPMASWVCPPITTIRQPIEKMSRLAVDAILQYDPAHFIPTQSVLEVSLVRRGTT